MKKAKKDYLKMTAEEIAELTGEFDRGAIAPSQPLNSELRARWDRARSGGAASIQIGPGGDEVNDNALPGSASIDGALLQRAIAKARKLKLKRSEYFSKALQLLTDGQVDVAGVTVRAVVAMSERVK